MRTGQPTCARGLPPDDGKLHVLDLDAHKQEVDLAEDHVLQVVPGHHHNQAAA